jgi:predicted PurR-regulated permease PerM
MQKTVRSKSGIDWRRVFRVAIAIAIVLIAAWFASRIPRTMSVFIIAAFIAFGVHPLVKALERRKVPRALGIAIVFTGLALIIVLALVLIVPLTIGQMQTLVQNVPAFVNSTQSWISGTSEWVRDKFPGFNVPANAFDLSQIGSSHLSALTSTTFSSVFGVLTGTATAFFVGFSALILSFFFLIYNKEVGENFVGMFPESKRKTAHQLGSEVTHLFGSYISGQIVVCAITGAVVAVAGALLGFKFWLIVGIIAGVAYAIPIFGMVIAQLIALVLCAPQGGWMILWMQVIMFGMARISDNVLVPKIMGDSVGVSPIGVMFAVFAGGELFGLPGLLLGIPAAALIKILWRYFAAPWITKQLDDE